jgi:hypothetical protein
VDGVDVRAAVAYAFAQIRIAHDEVDHSAVLWAGDAEEQHGQAWAHEQVKMSA